MQTPAPEGSSKIKWIIIGSCASALVLFFIFSGIRKKNAEAQKTHQITAREVVQTGLQIEGEPQAAIGIR
jgi:hypothetical protein